MVLEPQKKFHSPDLRRHYKPEERKYDAIFEEEEHLKERMVEEEPHLQVGIEVYDYSFAPVVATWPLLKIIRLLADNNFFADWRKAFIAENIHGQRFLDLLHEQHPSGWCLMCRSASPKLVWQNIRDEVKHDRELNWSEINEGERLISLVDKMNAETEGGRAAMETAVNDAAKVGDLDQRIIQA